MSKKKCDKCKKPKYDSDLNWCKKCKKFYCDDCSLKLESESFAVFKVQHYMYCPKDHQMANKYFDVRD